MDYRADGSSKKKKKKRVGQVLVEFALCIPLLVFMFGVIVDYGWTMYLQICLHNAVRDGAIMATYDGTFSASQIQNRVIQSMTAFSLSASNVSVNLNSTMTINSKAYKSYDISASFNYPFIVLLVFFPEVNQQIASRQRSLIVTGLTP